MKTLVAVACLATFASSYAQDKPAPPPIWQQGRPPEMADSKLAPHPGKMTETPPGEIPLDTIKLPEGFKAELWAHGLPGGRAMARGQKGKIYVGTRAIGRVYEVSDEGGKRRVRRRKLKVKPGQSVVLRPEGSRYQLAQPDSQTVCRLRSWTSPL